MHIKFMLTKLHRSVADAVPAVNIFKLKLHTSQVHRISNRGCILHHFLWRPNQKLFELFRYGIYIE